MRATTRLRQLIAGPKFLLAPGTYDGITARLIEQAGFSALYEWDALRVRFRDPPAPAPE